MSDENSNIKFEDVKLLTNLTYSIEIIEKKKILPEELENTSSAILTDTICLLSDKERRYTLKLLLLKELLREPNNLV